jgi:hypothetical protein
MNFTPNSTGAPQKLGQSRSPRARLDGCLDVDLESSALTNAFPVHRLGLDVGERADTPAAYVRALDLSVERLEQSYVRLDDDDGGRRRYHYAAPGFAFECELTYDDSGLVLDYPRHRGARRLSGAGIARVNGVVTSRLNGAVTSSDTTRR